MVIIQRETMNDKEIKVLRHIVAELLNNVQYTAEEKVIVETENGGYSICGTLRTAKSKIYSLSMSELNVMRKFVEQ